MGGPYTLLGAYLNPYISKTVSISHDNLELALVHVSQFLQSIHPNDMVTVNLNPLDSSRFHFHLSSSTRPVDLVVANYHTEDLARPSRTEVPYLVIYNQLETSVMTEVAFGLKSVQSLLAERFLKRESDLLQVMVSKADRKVNLVYQTPIIDYTLMQAMYIDLTPLYEIWENSL